MTGPTEFLQWFAKPDSALLARVLNPDERTRQILRGALEQFGLTGIRRTSMEDVARRSGIGRASLYRYFPSKAELVDAVILSEVRRFFEGSAQILKADVTFEERMVNNTVFNVKFFREHTLLKGLLAAEPDTILPNLTINAGTILDLATEWSVAQLATELYGHTPPSAQQLDRLRTVAELHVRITLSFVLTQHTSIQLDTPQEIRAFALNHMLPMLTGEASPEAVAHAGH